MHASEDVCALSATSVISANEDDRELSSRPPAEKPGVVPRRDASHTSGIASGVKRVHACGRGKNTPSPLGERPALKRQTLDYLASLGPSTAHVRGQPAVKMGSARRWLRSRGWACQRMPGSTSRLWQRLSAWTDRRRRAGCEWPSKRVTWPTWRSARGGRRALPWETRCRRKAPCCPIRTRWPQTGGWGVFYPPKHACTRARVQLRRQRMIAPGWNRANEHSGRVRFRVQAPGFPIWELPSCASDLDFPGSRSIGRRLGGVKRRVVIDSPLPGAVGQLAKSPCNDGAEGYVFTLDRSHRPHNPA